MKKLKDPLKEIIQLQYIVTKKLYCSQKLTKTEKKKLKDYENYMIKN